MRDLGDKTFVEVATVSSSPSNKFSSSASVATSSLSRIFKASSESGSLLPVFVDAATMLSSLSSAFSTFVMAMTSSLSRIFEASSDSERFGWMNFLTDSNYDGVLVS